MKNFFDRFFCGSYARSFFAGPLSSFDWRDVLDILVLAALFFAVYRYVRDRRAGRLLFGAALIVVVYAASELLDMYTMRYLLGNFFGYSLVVVAVIFQPELRALLEKAGSLSFGRLKTIGTESRNRSVLTPAALDEIVLAVKHMSFSKTGALIAIERSINIGEYAQSGTVLKSDISARLLQTIFFNMTPLHDGAVIIRDGHVFAAGCNLPLTQNTEPIKDLGTRHRAAVGASEDSDAIVIVVSEQTGIISLAYKGELIRNLTSVSLRRKLTVLLGMQRTQQREEGTK